MRDRGPRFDAPVADGGYAWWYVDALSDDGRHGLVLIAFVGSVFSPYYARARARGRGDPLRHCAMNVALYGSDGKRWTMTERGQAHVRRTRETFSVGPSSLAWDGASLTATIDEVALPWPSRVRGTVRLTAGALPRHVVALDGAGAHRWQPLAPLARVDVRFTQPDLAWSGSAYCDANDGDAPLADAFSGWHWSRANSPEGVSVLYDVERRGADALSVALHVDRAGNVREFAPPPVVPLPSTGWRVARRARSEAGHAPTVVRTLEDAPFYARSLVRLQLSGAPVVAIHESLSLDRFRSPWVQLMLPFRMPRRA
ncbi:MAG: carotenoid 1,2-hydratase [Burkholderiales bacterium]